MKIKKPLALLLSGVGVILITLISLAIYIAVKMNNINSVGGIIGGAGSSTLTFFVRAFFGECFGIFALLPIVGIALVVVAAVMRFKK